MLGHAVGLSPLVVLVSVTSVGILLGGFYVLLAIPIAAVLATLVDVVLRDVDPAAEEVPTLMFTAAGRSEQARRSATRCVTYVAVRPCASGRTRGRRA